MQLNKFNLQIGDIIIDGEERTTVTDIVGVGANLHPYRGHDRWDFINRNIDSGNWVIERAKKPFPEKWSVYGGTNLANFIKELKEKEIKIFQFYHGNALQYYNFNGVGIHSYDDKPEYEVVTIKQLRKHYLKEQKPTMDKKIVGYDLKKEFKDKEIYIAKALDTTTGKLYTTNGGYWLPSVGSVYQNAVDMKVLDLWFEPVYEAEEVKLTIGTPAKEVIIKKDGVWFGDTKFDRTTLEVIKDKFISNPLLGTNINIHIKKVWVGCEQGTEVTKEEVKRLIDEYVKLNKNA